ncbi:hypothetical protein BJ138DRAFT_1115924 [Hygrophoropsis aurantiaca]|uniref:Uncharacterized protein n=1 Tax=Hygrophoropsis aurantiaca TaxID=72124 RepID=A0ACB8A4H0_9AGAM|nr:hypothetical protein BJ138DRAFT_1115924 [Hygrophoropsis aurantiaca]
MSSSRRQPQDSYIRRNGFRESFPLAEDGEPDDLDIRNHRLAQYTLTNLGVFVPNLQTMKDSDVQVQNPAGDMLSDIEGRIKNLKQQHNEDLENLYAFQSQEYREEVLDIYRALDESTYMDIDESERAQVEFRAALDALYADCRKMKRWQHDLDDALDNLRYSYLKEFVSLQEQKARLEKQELQFRRQRDAQFPQSINEYHAIRDPNIQLRVAQFLTRSQQEQERMKDEFNWASRAVYALLEEYKRKDDFRSEIQKVATDRPAMDPRKRSAA